MVGFTVLGYIHFVCNQVQDYKYVIRAKCASLTNKSVSFTFNVSRVLINIVMLSSVIFCLMLKLVVSILPESLANNIECGLHVSTSEQGTHPTLM